MTHKASIPLHWRRITERYNLIGSKCQQCGRVYYPPRILCKKCRSAGELEEIELSGDGQVYSYTVIRNAPDHLKRSEPYIAAIIKLKEGPMISSQIVHAEPEEVSIGSEVEACFRKVYEEGERGIIKYGHRFRLKSKGD